MNLKALVHSLDNNVYPWYLVEKSRIDTYKLDYGIVARAGGLGDKYLIQVSKKSKLELDSAIENLRTLTRNQLRGV